MKFKHVIFSLIFLSVGSLSAQDFHNTYWQFAPNIISPTFTGAFYGNIRVNAIGRNQARPIVNLTPVLDGDDMNIRGNQKGQEFNDVSIGIDGNIPFGFTDGDWVSAGMNLSQSTVGAQNFKRSYTGLSLAYHMSLNKAQSKVFTIGLKYGSYSTNFDPSDLPVTSTPETLAGNLDDNDLSNFLEQYAENDQGGNALNTNDWMLGFMYTTPVGKDADLRIGIASDHLLNPRLMTNGNMVQDTTITPPIPTGPQTIKRLNRRFNAFVQYYYSMSDRMVWNPTILYQSTSNANQILIQSLFKFLVNEEKEFTFTAGLGVRINSSMDVPIFIGADYKDWQFGLSYDTNVTGLTQANSTFGALELGASKLINWQKPANVDPKFICPRL